VQAQQIAVMRSVCPKSTDRGIGETLQPQYLPAKDKNGILSGRLSAIICSYQTTRCTRMTRGVFPHGQSALNLAAARLRHIAGTAWSTKRYLNIELLKDQQMRGAIAA
jgi:hypothetical protein